MSPREFHPPSAGPAKCKNMDMPRQLETRTPRTRPSGVADDSATAGDTVKGVASSRAREAHPSDRAH